MTPPVLHPPMASLLTAKGVTHRYGKLTALDELALDLPTGSWALLGPNGAGKTTLIRLLLGLATPTRGQVSVLGTDPRKDPVGLRRRIGYMPESPALLPGLTGFQYVALAARMSGMAPAEARRGAHTALDACGLGEARYRTVEGYSTGMRQRVKLAQALAHDPELLILDEPTNGLDPEGRDSMLELIDTLAHEGRSLVLASHILHEVRRVCDHAVILAKGRAVHQGPLEELQVDLGGIVLEPLDEATPLVERLRAEGYVVDDSGGVLVIEGASELAALVRMASETGVALRAARAHQRAVHDVVVDLMEASP